jgi:aspartate carbamoyltransferase catalytic subunit
MTPDIADGPHSAILQQVTNGLAVRMAVLALLCGRESREGGTFRRQKRREAEVA